MGKKKKPPKNVEDIKTIVEILAGLANVALVIYTISKGGVRGAFAPLPLSP